MEKRFDCLEKGFDGLEKRFDQFERDVRLGFQVMDGRLRGLEEKIDSGLAEIRRDMKANAADIKGEIRLLLKGRASRRRPRR